MWRAQSRITRLSMLAVIVMAMFLVALAGSRMRAADARTADGGADDAAKPKPNPGSFITEGMRLMIQGKQTNMVLWMPYETFASINQGQGNDVPELKAYQIILVAEQLEKDDGTNTFATEEEVRAGATLTASDGRTAKPLAKIPPKMLVLLSAMKQAMTQQGGEINANLHVLLFPAKVDGKPLVDSAHKDKLSLSVKGTDTFGALSCTWHTPFDAAAGTHACPKCKEDVSAKWTYCPWCGQKLDR